MAKWVRLIVVSVLLGIGLVFIYRIDPGETRVIPCYVYELFHVYCAGCGLTRALHALVNFRFLAALRNNFLIYPFVLCGLFVYVSYFAKQLFGVDANGKVIRWLQRYLGVQQFTMKMLVVILGLVVVFFVVRNIPHVPFVYLRPE